MFNNLRLNIFIYYFITVVAFVGFSYYFLVVLALSNLLLLGVITLCFIVLAGVFVSKLAVDPLEIYVKNLQNLSTETLHELNLPITTIITNTQMLEKNLNESKSLKRLDRIKSACGMLQERYNELDYMIKMQSNEQISEEFNVADVLKSRVHFLEKIYPQMKFNIELQNLYVKGDKKGLAKVIDNIIDNGVKYSGNSKVLDIEIKNSKLFIQDYGVGMDEVEILHIFDKYYQSNSDIQGFGIGLSMVKRYCDANAIELGFHSKPNAGTQVQLQFKNIEES